MVLILSSVEDAAVVEVDLKLKVDAEVIEEGKDIINNKLLLKQREVKIAI